jgi:hypothetical protein
MNREHPLLSAIVWCLRIISDIPELPISQNNIDSALPPTAQSAPSAPSAPSARCDIVDQEADVLDIDLESIRMRRKDHITKSLSSWDSTNTLDLCDENSNMTTDSRTKSCPKIWWGGDESPDGETSPPLAVYETTDTYDTYLFKETTPPVRYYARTPHPPVIKGSRKGI